MATLIAVKNKIVNVDLCVIFSVCLQLLFVSIGIGEVCLLNADNNLGSRAVYDWK